MSEVKDTDYAINYLISVLEGISGMQDFEQGESKLNQSAEASLCTIFRRYITGNEDNVEHIFLSANNSTNLYLYDGKCYQQVDDEKLRYVIMSVMQKMGMNDIYTNNSSKKISDNCALVLRCDTDLKFHADRRYAIFNNCVLDLMDFTIKEHSIDYRSDLRFNFDYNPNAYSELWTEKLSETIVDESMRTVFQEFMGSLLDCRKFKIEYALFMIGPVGQNGKSLIVKSILRIFDGNLISNFDFQKLFKATNSEYYIAECDGKVANIVDELDYKDFSGGDFKAFVSNDEFSARPPYGRPYKTKSLPKLICNVNHMPPVTDDSGGFERRILPIRCPNLITDKNRDETLEEKMRAIPVKQAIFNWILEGYKRVVANNGKILLSQTMIDMRKDIMADTNSARRWLDEKFYVSCEPNGDYDSRWKSMVDIMREYKQFCMDYGYNSVSAKGVGRVLNRLGFKKKHTRTGSFYCIDIREDIKTEEENQMEADNLPF